MLKSVGRERVAAVTVELHQRVPLSLKAPQGEAFKKNKGPPPPSPPLPPPPSHPPLLFSSLALSICSPSSCCLQSCLSLAHSVGLLSWTTRCTSGGVCQENHPISNNLGTMLPLDGATLNHVAPMGPHHLCLTMWNLGATSPVPDYVAFRGHIVQCGRYGVTSL